MAYYTGSVNNFADLRAALADALTASHGWAWSGGAEELSKGAAIINLTASAVNLSARGRVAPGSDAGASGICRMGRPGTIEPSYDIVWPAIYRLFVFDDPDEAYLILQHSVDAFQWLAFGASSLGLPGSGTWLGATWAETTDTTQLVSMGITLAGLTNGGSALNPGLFSGRSNWSNAVSNAYLHHSLPDSAGEWLLWSGNNGSFVPTGWRSLLHTQPNTWNSEAILLPLRAWCARAEFRISCVAELRNARHIRLDYYEPGQILTLGPDRWMVFPWYRKNIANRDGGTSSGATAHTGTLGWAIRYDGP